MSHLRARGGQVSLNQGVGFAGQSGLQGVTQNPLDMGYPQVSFSGLAPGYIGLYQLNVALPEGVPSGTPDLTVEINGVTSNTVTLDVR